MCLGCRAALQGAVWTQPCLSSMRSELNAKYGKGTHVVVFPSMKGLLVYRQQGMGRSWSVVSSHPHIILKGIPDGAAPWRPSLCCGFARCTPCDELILIQRRSGISHTMGTPKSRRRSPVGPNRMPCPDDALESPEADRWFATIQRIAALLLASCHGFNFRSFSPPSCLSLIVVSNRQKMACAGKQ